MSSLQSIQWQINIDKQQERASIHWQISASRDSRGQCRKTLTLMTLFSYIDPDSFIVKFRPCSAESVRLPTAKTALNQPPMPSLRRGQHLKDACISTPWSIEVAGNPRGPKKKSFSWAWVRMLIYYGYIMDILWIWRVHRDWTQWTTVNIRRRVKLISGSPSKPMHHRPDSSDTLDLSVSLSKAKCWSIGSKLSRKFEHSARWVWPAMGKTRTFGVPYRYRNRWSSNVFKFLFWTHSGKQVDDHNTQNTNNI
jgi:hypothetical protein